MLSCSVVSDSLQPHGVALPDSSVYGDSPGKNIGVGCHALLQGIFPTQGLNPGLPHCRQTLEPLSIIGYWNAKVGSQEIPGVTGNIGFGVQNEAGQRLAEFCEENVLIIRNTLFRQCKRWLHINIPRWSTSKSDWLYSLQSKMEKLYTVRKTKLGVDCDSDHQFLIVKIRLKWKKVGKTTRPFRYDLNQILSDYTVEVTNRFKGLDFIDRVPEELWMEVHDIVQETGIKTIPKENKCKKKENGCLGSPYK